MSKRTTFLRNIAFLKLSFLAISSWAIEKKPNILVLVTDDQKLDTVACYGLNPNAYSPNLDKLAEEGVRFNNAFCNSPQCVTSRRSYSVGKYSHHIGVYSFEKTHPYHDSFRPFWENQLSKQQGYINVIVGKEHRNFIWDWSPQKGQHLSAYLTEYGFTQKDLIPDRIVHYWRQRDIEDPFYTHETVNGKKKVRNNWFKIYEDEPHSFIRSYRRLRKGIVDLIFAGYNPRPVGDTIDDHIFKDFERTLGELAVEDKPLAIQLAYKFPHTPVIPPRSIAKKFEALDFLIPQFTIREKQEILAVPQIKEYYTSLRSDGMKDHEIKKIIAHHFAQCAYGDAILGQSIESFKALSESQNRPWIIIFTSDHGVHLHEHGMIEKFTMYDESVHVPFIVASSDKNRFPAGLVYDGFVELIDIAPTLLAFAGEDLASPRYNYLDGYDVSGLIHGRIPPRESILVESSHLAGHRALLRTKDYAFSMRTRPADTKFAWGEDYDWARNAQEDEVEMVLFDLQKDPEELFNVANHSDYRVIRDRLRIQLQDKVLGPDRNEHPWHLETGQKPPFFYPTAHLYSGD